MFTAILASVEIPPAPLSPPRRAVEEAGEYRVADAVIKAALGLDHRVGHLASMTTEQTPDSIQRGMATRELPRHP
jgi:hypothetical protein